VGTLSDYTTRLLRHPLALFGGWLATLGGVLFLVVFVADLFGLVSNPYIGIVFFLVLPGMFLFGLALIPSGWPSRAAGTGAAGEHSTGPCSTSTSRTTVTWRSFLSA